MRPKHLPRPIDEFLATAKRDGLPFALQTFGLPASSSFGDFTLPSAAQIFALLQTTLRSFAVNVLRILTPKPPFVWHTKKTDTPGRRRWS
jgi:hypothetical protein